MRIALSDQANSDLCRSLSRLLVATPLVVIVLTLIALYSAIYTHDPAQSRIDRLLLSNWVHCPVST